MKKKYDNTIIKFTLFVIISFILLLVAAYFIIPFIIDYRSRDFPIPWEYKKEIIEICDDNNYPSVKYDEFYYNAETDLYTLYLYFNESENNEDYLSDTIKKFNCILEFVSYDSTHPLHNKKICIMAKERYSSADDYFLLANYNPSNINNFVTDRCIFVRINTTEIKSLASLELIKNDIQYLSISRFNYIDIDDFIKLNNLLVLNIDCCKYSNEENALNSEDVNILKKTLDKVQIDVSYLNF